MSNSLQPHGLSMEFSRQEYWSGLLFPSPGYLPHPGIKPRSPTLQRESLSLSYQGSPPPPDKASFPLNLSHPFPTPRFSHMRMSLNNRSFLSTKNVLLNSNTSGACACVLSHLSHVWLFVTPWTVALQAPLSMGFSRWEYWSGSPCPPPGELPYPGSNPSRLCFLHCQADSFFAPNTTGEVPQFNSVAQSCPTLCGSWTATRQASLSITY